MGKVKYHAVRALKLKKGSLISYDTIIDFAHVKATATWTVIQGTQDYRTGTVEKDRVKNKNSFVLQDEYLWYNMC